MNKNVKLTDRLEIHPPGHIEGGIHHRTQSGVNKNQALGLKQRFHAPREIAKLPLRSKGKGKWVAYEQAPVAAIITRYEQAVWMMPG